MHRLYMQLRVLESKLARLVIQLNDELKEKRASVGLSQALNDCTWLLDEVEKTMAKRDAIYAAVEQQEADEKGDGNGGDGAGPSSPPSAGM
jgi:hypothetical protein